MTDPRNTNPNSEHPAPAPGAAASQPIVPEPPARRPRAVEPLPGSGAPACAAGPVPAAPVVPQPLPRKSNAWIVALVAVVLMAVVCLVGIHSCSSTLTTLADPFGSSSSAVDSVITSDSIGIIEMSGTIDYDGSLCSPEGLKAQLDRAEANDHIKAVVLRVNSGGGTATAGEEMAAYVRDFPKPVVVSSAAINASAAYEISSQADYIYVAQTTSIGSIGTALQVTNVGELLEKLGISVENITSADSKDASYGTRPLTEEERAYYQAMVDQINGTFIKAVAEGRGMSEAEVRKLATGLPFTGIDAVGNGLADELGSLEDAVAKAASLAGSGTDETVYLYASSSNISSLLDLMSESRNDGRASLGALAEEVAR